MSFIAGHYTATFTPPSGQAASIGDTREGFHVREQQHADYIQTDTYGDGRVDGIQRGQDVEVQLDYVDYDLIETALHGAFPVGNAKSNVGKLLSGLAGQLVLTPAAGTSGTGLKAYTFPLAVVATDLDTLLANKLRSGPATFVCLPNSNGACFTVSP